LEVRLSADRAAVVHAENVVSGRICVTKYRVVGASIPLPRLVGDQGHLLRLRLLQLEPGVAFDRVDDVIVDEQLALRADIHGLGGEGHKRDTADRENGRYESIYQQLRHLLCPF